MDLRQLAALVAVADHGSFTSAARALFTVQSNVSSHVARLEKELGVTLVDRARGQLTEEGLVVVARAREMQRAVEAIHDDLASLGKEVSGETRIGVISTTARWAVRSLLTTLDERYPLVRAIIVEANTTSLLPQLLGGRLDVVVVNLPVDDPDVDVEPLFEEDLLALVRRDHPLGRAGPIALADLAGHRLVLPPRGTSLREDLDEEARRMGVVLDPVAEVDGVLLMTGLAVEGFAATLIPATAVPTTRSDVVAVPIRDLARRQVGIVRRRRSTLPAPARAVVATLKELVGRMGPEQRGVHVVASAGGPGDAV